MSSLTLALPGSRFARSLSGAIAYGDAADLLSPLVLQRPEDSPPAAHVGANREKLAAAMVEQNRAWQHPGATELADQLADESTLVVVTGQQPGLFGGPLYSLSKAVATVLWAERFRQAGKKAVAVFWIATEDHDFKEVATARLQTSDGVCSLDLGEDREPLRPVGDRRLGFDPDSLSAMLDTFEQLGRGDRHQHAAAEARRCCGPETTFGDAFARVLVALLGERCPLLLDSTLPELKKQQAPWLGRLVERRREVGQALAAAEAEVVARGFDLQVPASEAAPLFLVEGGERRRIEWLGDDEFTVRGRDGSRPLAELQRIAEVTPELLSPSALARPALQDAVLGVALQVMGPGELAYLAQARAIYGALEVAAPRTSLRPQVLLLDPKQERHIEELEQAGISLEQLLGPEQELATRMAELTGHRFVEPVRASILEQVDSLRSPTLELDPSLENPWQKTRDLVDRALDLLDQKVTAAAARSDETRARRVESLRGHLLPDGKLQERTFCCLSAYARYGEDLVTSLFENLQLDPSVLQLIVVDS